MKKSKSNKLKKFKKLKKSKKLKKTNKFLGGANKNMVDKGKNNNNNNNNNKDKFINIEVLIMDDPSPHEYTVCKNDSVFNTIMKHTNNKVNLPRMLQVVYFGDDEIKSNNIHTFEDYHIEDGARLVIRIVDRPFYLIRTITKCFETKYAASIEQPSKVDYIKDEESSEFIIFESIDAASEKREQIIPELHKRKMKWSYGSNGYEETLTEVEILECHNCLKENWQENTKDLRSIFLVMMKYPDGTEKWLRPPFENKIYETRPNLLKNDMPIVFELNDLDSESVKKILYSQKDSPDVENILEPVPLSVRLEKYKEIPSFHIFVCNFVNPPMENQLLMTNPRQSSIMYNFDWN